MNKELVPMWKGNTQKVRAGTRYRAGTSPKNVGMKLGKVRLKLVRDVRENTRGFLK